MPSNAASYYSNMETEISSSSTNDNNTLHSTNEQSEIMQFYNDGKIFITGGTGFVGKVLVEKLLRSCATLSSIYLLLKHKRDRSPEERCEDLLQTSVFDRIREEKCCEKIFSKVVCIRGDLSEPDIGLSEEDRDKLLEETTVVFHLAATVRFDESLDSAIRINTLGTERMLLFCKQMKNLKAFIHVSTAYSNVDREEISEIIYPIPVISFSDEEIISSEKKFKKLAKHMQKYHPNTYTVTKALAEWVAFDHHDRFDIPIAIVRPSIVAAAWREPFEGWVDNVANLTGIMMEFGRGTLRTFICDKRLVVDLIPVDLVVNTLIAAAWHTATFRTDAIKVYNCTSGSLNPLSWEKFGALTKHYSLITPTKYIQWYPGFTLHTNHFMHFLYDKIFHYFPAILADAALFLSGSKPIMLKIYNKFQAVTKTCKYFALHQWHFASENIQSLHNEMHSAVDRQIFSVEISTLCWDQYFKNYVCGIRKFVLKDPIESVTSAREKLRRLYWAHKIVQLLLGAVLFILVKDLIFKLISIFNITV